MEPPRVARRDWLETKGGVQQARAITGAKAAGDAEQHTEERPGLNSATLVELSAGYQDTVTLFDID